MVNESLSSVGPKSSQLDVETQTFFYQCFVHCLQPLIGTQNAQRCSVYFEMLKIHLEH